MDEESVTSVGLTTSKAPRMEVTTMLCKEICEDCGKLFIGGANAYFCPECRIRRQRESAKRRNLSQIGINARKKKRGDNDA